MMQSFKKINKKITVLIVIFAIILILVCYVMTGRSVYVENLFYNKISVCITPSLTNILKFISRIGSASFVSFYCMALIALKKTRKKFGVAASISVFMSQMLNFILKNIFKRQRPNINPLVFENGYSFPSGHAMVSTAFCIIILLIALKYIKNKKIKTIIAIFCILMPIVIGFSRIYLGVHYLFDVLVGYLMGAFVAIFTYFFIERINDNQIKLIEASSKISD